MVVKVQPIIQRAHDIVVDAKGRRWPAPMLVRFFNDGVRELVLYRPDSTSKRATISLVDGVRQKLPADGVKLLDLPANTAGRPITLVEDRALLDASDPGWRRAQRSTVIKHFLYDVRDPDAFDVYPPAKGGITVEIDYSVMPAEIAAPAGNTVASVSGEVAEMQDVFANALLDYVLYRAFQPDAEHAGNEARAQTHYRAFATAVGGELRATVLAAPNRRGTANTAAIAAATAST